MALQSAYKQFLDFPNPTFLASNASLHYITTLVTLNGSSEIIKHLANQDHELKKKEQKFLDVVESPNSLAVEVHTTLEFLAGGGSYLPGLDDNFLADRSVTFPIIHFVSFDANGKIQQVRQSWDQGSLLKLIDVIGKTGRNWPICDGKDQINLISSSIKSAGKHTGGPAPGEDEVVTRSRGNSNNVTRDPHASLALFAPRDKIVQDSLPAVIETRASAKPPPRDYNELFVSNDSDNPPASPNKTPPRGRSESPSKSVAAKAGAGKNYAPSRLFDNDENSPIRPSPDKIHSAEHFYRPNPTKYQHFDFADGSDPKDASRPAPPKEFKSQSTNHWNFEDFNTPAKVIPSKVLRTNEVRHWGNSDDEAVDSPIKVKKVDKPRKDAETHFEFKDDGTPDGGPRLIGRPRGAGQNNGLGLYKELSYDGNSEAAAGEVAKPVNSIANVKDRRKDFDSHFTMTDDSPASKPPPERLPGDRAEAVKMMDANWSSYDQSPNQKENVPAPSTSRLNIGIGKGPLSESTNAMSNRNDPPKGISVGSDGMGGKKGTGRNWGFGDDSDGEEDGGVNKPGKHRAGKQQGKAQAPGGDFWDF